MTLGKTLLSGPPTPSAQLDGAQDQVPGIPPALSWKAGDRGVRLREGRGSRPGRMGAEEAGPLLAVDGPGSFARDLEVFTSGASSHPALGDSGFLSSCLFPGHPPSQRSL